LTETFIFESILLGGEVSLDSLAVSEVEPSEVSELPELEQLPRVTTRIAAIPARLMIDLFIK
jgi:hypothetical protein